MFVVRIAAAAVALTLASCTWVKMEPGGQSVRIARAGDDLSYCTRLGEIAVEVKDQVGFYQRDPIKVRDELEVMARNEAPRMQADTLQAVDEPLNGEQRFTAFRCRGSNAPAATSPVGTPRDSGAAETFPVRGG